MLSKIGRAAIKRVGAGTSNASTNRLISSIWILQRAGAFSKTDNASIRAQLSPPLRRLYATATKITVNTSTKKAATTKSNLKKPAPKKKAVTKPATKKPKKKKVAAKPKPKPKKPKKILTVEQKAKVDQKKARDALKVLRRAALTPPKGKPSTAWTVLNGELQSEQSGSKKSAAVVAKEAAAKYKSLTPEETEHYNHIANQNKVANSIALQQWTESHTPEEIRVANNARHLLKKRTGKAHSPLKDDRIPKRTRSPWALFTADRWATGDFKGLKVVEANELLRKEYQSLSDVDRKVYENRSVADKQRYTEEFKTVFQRDPKYIKNAAAAA